MPRKESKKDQKPTRAKAKKQPAAAKTSPPDKAVKVRKTRAAKVEKAPSIPPIPPVVESLSSARLGICFFNKSDCVDYFNQYFSEITGLQLEKLAGKKLGENMLWSPQDPKDEFQELFIEAMQSGKTVAREHLPVVIGKEEDKYWNLNLLPQYDENAEYGGMFLVIEETSESKPKAGISAILNEILQAALQHDETQSLLDNLVDIIKDFSHCSYVRVAVVDKTGNRVIRAETGKEQGLWDTDQTLSADDIGRIFEGDGSEAAHITGRGSVYLEDIGRVEDDLSGALKELVINLRNSYGFRSLAFIPIKVDDRISGFIQLANKKAGGMSADVLDAVEITSDQLKIIMDRMGLKDEVRRQREGLLRQMHERGAHLEALSERLKQEISERKKRQEEMREQRDLAVKLSAIVDMNEASQACLDTAIRLAGADCGALYVKDGQTGELVMQYSKGLTDEFIAVVSHYDPSSPNYELVSQMKPVYATMESLESTIGDRYKVEGLKGAALIPIVYNNEAIGCMNIASHVLDEIPASNALEVIAAQIGSAISRIQGREELIDSEERYRTLFTRSANPILIFDFDGKYLDGNDAALAFLECTREELQAMNMRDTLPPYLDEQWFQQHRESWEQGGLVERDYYVWGKIKVMEMTFTPLQLGNSRVLIGAGTDITERKKVEAALQKSEEKYRLHVNSVADVIFSFDPEMKVLDVSPSVERLLGHKPEELVGRRFEELNIISPEFVPEVVENIKSVLGGTQVENVQYQAIAKDGTIKHVEVSGAPVYSGAKIIGIVSVARDITERERAQEALRKSEEQYRMLAENIMDVACLMDMDFHIIWITPSGEKISGYTLEELNKLPISKRVTRASIEAAQEVLWPAANEAKEGKGEPGHIYSLVQEVYRKDGSTIWTDNKFLFIRDENGRAHTVFMVGRDVTEHRKMGQSLADSESRYRSLVESGGAGVVTANINGEISFVNETYCRIIGYTKDELLGKPFADYIYTEDRERIFNIFTDALLGVPERPHLEFRVVHKDGHPVWLYTNPTETVIDGEIIGFSAILQDITENKEIEQALVESESHYRSLVESSGAGIATVNMAGEISFVNDALCAMTGYSREEVMAKPFMEFVHPEDIGNTVALFNEAVAGQKPHYVQFRLVCKDGKAAWFYTNPTELVINSQTVGFSTILQDITENKDAEEALRLSEEKFRDLADLLPQVVYEADREGLITYINRRGYEAFRYGPEEMVNKLKLTDLMVTGERESVRDNYLRIMDGEPSSGNEYTALRKDGSTFHAIVFSSPIIKEGKAVGLRGMYTDISRIKQTENDLRESEEKYRSLVENAGEAIFIAQDGKVKFANPRSFEIVHYAKEELFSRPFTEFIHPEYREIVAERYAQRIRGEETVPVYDMRLVDQDRTAKWVELRATRIQWEGRPATLNFMTDITVRKEAEKALKESEERYRLLAENSLDVIWTADMRGEITYISPSIRYIVGRSSEEIMGIYRRGTLTPEVFGVTAEDMDRFTNGIKGLIKDPSRTQSFEFGLKHADGFSSWVDVKMSIMRDQNGQAAGILGIVRDITQQKKMTERLVSADRLASLGEMAGGLAHEVNNPLTAVMGFAYLLQQNPDVPPDIKKDVDAIYREGKRAADVIKSFLLFARGHGQEKQAVFINDILEGVIRLRRSQMTKENIEVISELADDLPAVQGDVSQLQQALLNIVMNAEFFMYKSNKGGHLTFNSTFKDGKIRIQITDDGPGIPAEKLNRVFDPFYTTKDVGEGTGLGLSICHGIIKGHGGDIYLESSEGKGATFIVELPPGK